MRSGRLQWYSRPPDARARPMKRLDSSDAGFAAEFDRLRSHKKLVKIGRSDLLIASIALAHQATLVTRNVRHFRQVPGLNVENWADES